MILLPDLVPKLGQPGKTLRQFCGTIWTRATTKYVEYSSTPTCISGLQEWSSYAEPFVPHKKICVFFKKETIQRGFIFVRKYNSFSKANISPLFVFARGTQETKNWIWNSGQIQRTQGLSIPVGSNPHESRHDRIKGNAPFAPLLESFIYLYWVLVATRRLRIIAKRST